MILADTSAWVEFVRATGSDVHHRLAQLIDEEGPLAVTEPVLMEVALGARSPEDEGNLRRLMLRFDLLRFEPVADFDIAARVYQECRRAGFTIRGLLDCLIAAVAWRRGASLLAWDADLGRIADVIGIEMDPASLAA